MKKLKVPELIQNNDLPDKMSQKEFEKMMEERHFEFVPEIYLDIDGLRAISYMNYIGGKGDYIYAYISSAPSYYDYAIIKTDDFFFRTYAQWKKAVKAMAAQLVKRWKAWVRGLYKEDRV